MTTTTASAPPAVAAPATGPAGRPYRRNRFRRLRLVSAVLITAVMAFPLYWMLLTAFSRRDDLYAPGLHLWPQHFTWDNFSAPIERFPVWTWFRNSLVIAVAVTAITVVCNLLAGYAFAKFRFRGKNILFLVLLSTMMIPVQAIMVPQFRIATDLGLYGDLWAVILPESAAVFGIFLARQFFLGIPDELIEAARIDGAGALRVFWSVVLPLAKPLIAVSVLLAFMNEWNSFSWPLIVLFANEQLFTMPLGLVTDLQSQYTSDYGAIMAITLLSVTPILVLFVAFQRYFVQGLARTGLK
ncbi:carbohydrate ABC transporter permease [Nakamurella endophytica]|uniref:Sugar ABC transporter permease n=1 Tax=Nakamurella endophytica TaxID=1748367 RepID=A0A917T310_9ACTN|nr:carbohydrate ABC transporter permease [Nakamurella endophytica]GGM07134.1 sugar ABC transporter permease [Nakamurella endophytica]